jgi:hypothetical protein
MFGAGTHGQLRRYRYSIPKNKLELAVIKLIEKNPIIYRDTINKDYYNDGITYLTIKIKNKEIENEYVFRYYGDQEGWKNSTNSEIFICYAYDKYGKGGSDGSGNFTREQKKELIDAFNKFFIDQLDSALSIHHTEEIGQ